MVYNVGGVVHGGVLTKFNLGTNIKRWLSSLSLYMYMCGSIRI